MRKGAVIAIDLHRGHLDPAVATMSLPEEKCQAVVAANQRFLDYFRKRHVPIIHLLTQYRNAEEILSNPAWRYRADNSNATRKNVARHNIRGMPGVKIMPELWHEGDVLIDTKKRYDCFIGTDLEFSLHSMGITHLYVTGVNTNSCVLATSIHASVIDYDVTIVSDCVDTMDGKNLHENALELFERAFGKVMSSEKLITEIENAKTSDTL